jgi:low temperature requirement protein LtrA
VVGPLELFYDLAVVVLVAQAAHRLAGHLTWAGLGQFAAVFTLVWIAWANGSLHHELHGHDDARARSTFLLQILVLAAMGASIPQASGARGATFAVAAAVLFAVLAVLWLLAGRGDRPEYRRPSRLFVTGTAACAVLLTTDPADEPGVVITEALTERFGAFIIIVLGETLTGVVSGLSSRPVSGLTLAVGLAAVVVGFGAWWTYFDFAGQRQPGTGRVASVQWILGHLPLTAAVAAMGAAVVLLATMLLAATLPAWGHDRGLYRPLARTCTASAVACLGLAAARPAPLLLALGLVLLLSIPWVYAVARRLAEAAGGSDRGSGPSGAKVSDTASSLRRSAKAGRPADLRERDRRSAVAAKRPEKECLVRAD